MTTKKTEAPIDQVRDAEPKRGRPSSGIPRGETFKRASKANRAKQLESGKVELKCFVSPETKEWLAAQKGALSFSTVGEVLDLLAQQAEKKDK
jgi:hypothetical protein